MPRVALLCNIYVNVYYYRFDECWLVIYTGGGWFDLGTVGTCYVKKWLRPNLLIHVLSWCFSVLLHVVFVSWTEVFGISIMSQNGILLELCSPSKTKFDETKRLYLLVDLWFCLILDMASVEPQISFVFLLSQQFTSLCTLSSIAKCKKKRRRRKQAF
jgi:hypothetical protein